MHERTVAVKGLRVKLATTGSGPPLVLLHGLMGTHSYWLPFARRLACAHTVVLVDLPGHGESDPLRPFEFATCARLVADACDTVGITRPIVAGHSLGSVALHWAAQRPVSALMLISPIGGEPLDASVPRWERALGRPLLGCVPLWEWLVVRPGLARSLVFETFVGMSTLDGLDRSMARDLVRGAAGTAGVVQDMLPALDGLDLRSLAAGLDVPAVVCFGQRDGLGAANGPPLAAALRATSVAIPDVGHMPMIESPYALRAAFRSLPG